MGYIYIITNEVNNKQYIGQTKNKVDYRLTQHKYKALHTNINNAIYNAIKKYGEDKFSIDTLIVCDDAMMDYYEKQSIEMYNTLSPNGYNLEAGGTRGYVISDETRKKLSEASKGKPPMSDAGRKKLSEVHKGKIITQEHKQAISEFNKGKIVSEETRKKISEAKKGVPRSEETKKKLSEARKGQTGTKHTEEHKKYMSEIMKGRKMDEETKKKLSEANTGRKLTEEHKKKLSEAHIGTKRSDEAKKNISEGAKRGWEKRRGKRNN